MRKIFIILLTIIFILSFSFTCYCETESDIVNKISISVNIKPIQSDLYNYTYETKSPSEIVYILHLLNSIKKIDDGVILNGADIPIVNINIFTQDNSYINVGFVNGRFCDIYGNQFNVGNDYGRFLSFVYALKNNILVFENDVTYDISEWAKEEVTKAIEKNLVPKLNQINYQGKITRLEVCQLIANYIEQKGITEQLDISPFSDTSDPSIIMLYSLNIINGKSNDLFAPYDFITREEFAKILFNTYKLTHDIENNIVIETHYKYDDRISSWAKEAVAVMTTSGIFKGIENAEFAPQKNITKEQVITAIVRLEE